MTKWLEEVRNNSSKAITVILIGNKKDLEDKRQVSYEEGEAFAKENGLMFLETSAKTAYNVVESFNLSAEAILNNIQTNGMDPTANSNVRLDDKALAGGISSGVTNGTGGNKGGCC